MPSCECCLSSRLKEVKARIVEKQARRDEVDYLTVHHDGKVEFTFLDGSKIFIKNS
ncbi:hypothetical protein QP776_04545 [Gardnerella vaginalis]|uniref:hypothetical protein n=1 Tax=Gardnerella vaginalis TaxID=2702 RepID=UPI00254F2726|nr:hypothetical protein [Gardnerella vaginalis]MDK8338012.1 hypothetical protein [Gardnerella vaginalis]